MNIFHIKSLTSLRFFAAFMVLSSHLPLNVLIPDKSSITKSTLYEICHAGYVGVTFFFILSGFILTYNYYYLIQKNQMTMKEFLILRAARLYPTHVLTFILSLPVIYFTLKFSAHHSPIFNKFQYFSNYTLYTFYFVASGVINLFLLQSFIPFWMFYWSYNLVSWSISNEAFFYFVCFFLLSANNKTLAIVCFLEFMMILILLVAFNHFHFSEDISRWTFYINPFVRIFDFILGICLAKYYMFNIQKINYPVHNLLTKILFTFLELVTISLLAGFFYAAIIYQVNQLYLWDLFYILPMGLIIFVFALERGFLSSLLKYRLFIFLGEISFAIYMFHQLILRCIASIIEHFEILIITIPEKILLITVIIATIITVSSFSFLYYEKILNNFFRRLLLPNKKKNNLQSNLDIANPIVNLIGS